MREITTLRELCNIKTLNPCCGGHAQEFPIAADRLNPYAVDAYDGINLNPLEVVFVKVKGFLLQADWSAPKTSQTYDRWLSHQVSLLHTPHMNVGAISHLHAQRIVLL